MLGGVEGLFAGEQFAGEVVVGFGAARGGRVLEDGLPEAGRFAEANRARHDGAEGLGKMPPDFVHNPLR